MDYLNYKDGKVYRINGYYIPARMMVSVINYIEYGISPGKFLRSIIKGELYNTFWSADSENIKNIPAYIEFFYRCSPAGCWGTEDRYMKWLGRRGKERGYTK